MDCSTAAIGLLVPVGTILALAGMLAFPFRAARVNKLAAEVARLPGLPGAARLTTLAAEVERLRDLSRANAAAVAGLAAEIARLRARHEQAAPAKGEVGTAPAEAAG